MKTIFTLMTVLVLVCLAATAKADDANLPLDKKISVEKLVLIEEYQTALQRCREYTKKTAKHSCIKQQKDALAKSLENLQDDPRAYFKSKEGKFQDDASLQDARRQISSGKGT